MRRHDIITHKPTASLNFDSINKNLPSVQGIYKITCIPNQKAYIGQSVNIRCRAHEHRRDLEKGTHDNTIMQNAYDKYGKDAFIVSLIEVVEDYEKLRDREEYWVEYYQSLSSQKGFNICPIKEGYLPSREWGDKVRGSKNGNSILNEIDIPYICKLINSKKYTYRAIGNMFGVSANAIRDIKSGRTWGHISRYYLDRSFAQSENKNLYYSYLSY